MKTYDKNKVIEVLREIFNHINSVQTPIPWFVSLRRMRLGITIEANYERENVLKLELAKNLINKLVSEEEVTLTAEEIEYFLIDREKHSINDSILSIFRTLEVDMTGVNFDDLKLWSTEFKGLENVTINLDKIVNKCLYDTTFKKAKFTGSFDNAKIGSTCFIECESENAIDPQKIADKQMNDSGFGGIEINGSFDGVYIEDTIFTNAKGTIKINPQKYPTKELYGLCFYNCYIIGDQIPGTDLYEEPSFEGCSIAKCSFAGVKNDVTIDLDKLKCGNEYYGDVADNAKIYNTNLTGVRLIGTIKEEDAQVVKNCYVCDETGKRSYIDLSNPATYENLDNIQVNVIPKEEPKTKSKFFDFLKNNKSKKAE